MLPIAVIASRYELRAKLGAGAAAEVFSVWDREAGRELALKLFRPESSAGRGLLAFTREFDLYKALSNPHLIKVHDLGVQSLESGDRPWFTMDLVRGTPIDQALTHRVSVIELARVADAVLEALDELHSHGMIHADVTANNILAGPGWNGVPAEIWLTDLGLATLSDQAHEGVLRGTLATMPPEAVRGGRLDARADLYSLGCVLYRLSTGVEPFVAATPSELLRAHLSLDPLPPRTLNPELSEEWEKLVLALLAKAPEERPGSARAVRGWLTPYTGRAAESITTPRQPLRARLVDREREVQALSESIAALQQRRGSTLLFSGPSGVGKSRMIEEGLLLARRAGLEARSVRASDLPHRPFAAIDRLLQSEPSSARSNRFPQRSSLVLLVDDADLCDSASQQQLEKWSQRIDGGADLLLVLSTSQTSSEGLESSLLDLGSVRRLRLQPLEREGALALAGSVIGRRELGRDWLPLFERLCGGLPASIERLAAWLLESDTAFSPQVERELALRWEREHELRHPGSVKDQLDPAELAIVQVLAIADGDPVLLEDCARIDPRAGQDRHALPRLIERGWVRRVALEEGRIGLVLSGPTGSRSWVAEIPGAELRTLHLRREETLRGSIGHEARRAEHLLAAGRHDLALPLLAAALERALLDRATRQALTLAERALALSPLTPLWSALFSRERARALAANGRAGAAHEAFRVALDRAAAAGDRAIEADTLVAAAVFAGERGELAPALAELERALAFRDELGDAPGGARVLLAMAQLLMRHGRWPEARSRLQSALSQARRAAAPALEAELSLALGDVLRAQGAHSEAGDQYRRADRLLSAESSDVARLPALRGRVLALEAEGRIDEASTECDGWRIAADAAGDQAQSAEALGLSARFEAQRGGRLEALRKADQAIDLWRQLGVRAERVVLRAESARWLFDRGQPRLALAKLREASDLAGTDSERRAIETVEIELLARLGRASAVEAIASRWASGDEWQRTQSVAWRGIAEFAAGRVGESRVALQEACFVTRRGNQPRSEIAPLAALAEAYLRLADAERAHLALRRVRHLAEELRDPEWRAQAELLAAEHELVVPQGDLRSALESAEHAVELFAGRERGDLLWRAHAVLARAARRRGAADLLRRARAESSRWAEAWISALPEEDRDRWRQHPWLSADSADPKSVESTDAGLSNRSLGDALRQIQSYERLLSINAALNSTLALDELLTKLLDTALELTGAERGFVLLEVHGATATEHVRGAGGANLAGSDREFSRAIARRVMHDGETLMTLDARGDERLSASQSVHALGIQSVLAAPLRVRGVSCGALVLDTRRGGALLEPLHRNLIERLADQAGIAIGNARLIDELRRQADEIQRLNRQLAEQVEEQKVELLEKQSNLELRYRYESLIGASPAMQKVYRALDKIAPSEIPVLVTGESGTGKDLVANVLHYTGPRSRERFVTVNCAALTETLLESELFGHRRGAFTGADRDRKGLFEQADKGTLFLDEIGEMPISLQPKLLRAIQFGEIRRVGEDTPRHVDVRIIAATHRDLTQQVKAGRFREDLLYRLDVARIHLAPLRERLEDLGLLIDSLLEKVAKGGEPKRIEPAALRLFLRHSWPGNVRELEHEVIKLSTFSEGQTISELDLLENAAFLDRARSVQSQEMVATLEHAEVEQIRSALKAAKGNRSKAAELLGIDRSTLYRKLKRLGDEDESAPQA